MLLTSFDPFAQEFDRLAQRVFGAVEGPFARVSGVMPMDATKRENEIVLRFDLPGVDSGSIDVTVDHRVLTVSARRSQDSGGEDGTAITRERVVGAFTRRVYLAETVDTDKIDAAYTDGVLTVRLPLLERARPRKIEITVGDAKKITA